ncbi:hypothetical protein ABNB59_21735 [Paenibacillus larvae]|nr:hypothetical protein [Paenibacillus larvae]MCY7478954.1 hypothetical protein [Paenibacillus larvae]MCY7521087.1 hypothetical protein [Paenibacillus larvae]MCY9565086.1 hypothetical protein [Paenibacillus larvae]MCY9569955.1 hypothetical protein [Paenibacillus larvae]MCY9574199.1 hypothetical protein [Paenibacillus larvae]
MKKFKKWLLSIAVVAAILGSGIALSTPQAYMDLVIKKNFYTPKTGLL